MSKLDKKAQARRWVNGYTVAGTAIVVAAIVPGSTSAALVAMEVHMCYEIGKIYRGKIYTLKDAARAAKVIGLVALAAQIVALEALDFVPFAGWAVKGGLAGGIIKTMGETVIAFYERHDAEEEEEKPVKRKAPKRIAKKKKPLKKVKIIDVTSSVTTLPLSPAPLLLAAPSVTPAPEPSAHDRLHKLNHLLESRLISQTEYDTKRQQILEAL